MLHSLKNTTNPTLSLAHVPVWVQSQPNDSFMFIAMCDISSIKEVVMHELDHMLNGQSSRRHHQDIIRAVQQERLAREAAASRHHAAPAAHKTTSPLRAALSAVIQTVLG